MPATLRIAIRLQRSRVLKDGVDVGLRGRIAGVVGQQQVVVAPVDQGVVDALVAGGLFGVEVPALDEVEHGLQRGLLFQDLARLVAALAQGRHFRRGVAER